MMLEESEYGGISRKKAERQGQKDGEYFLTRMNKIHSGTT